MSFGQLFVLSPNNSHIFWLHLSSFIKLVLLFINKSFGYIESKKLSPVAQKQRVLSWKNKIFTSITPNDVADPEPHHFG